MHTTHPTSLSPGSGNPYQPRGILRQSSQPPNRSASASLPPSQSPPSDDISHHKRFSLSDTDERLPRRLPNHPHAQLYNPANRVVSLPTQIDMERDRSAIACGKVPSPLAPSFPYLPAPALLPSPNDAIAQPEKPPTIVPRRVMRKLRTLLKHVDAKPEHHLDYEEVKAMCKQDMRERKIREVYRAGMTEGEVPLTHKNKDVGEYRCLNSLLL
jgi:hypothetical protein